MTLVPRGLQDVVLELLPKQLQQQQQRQGDSASSLVIRTEILGEQGFYSDPQMLQELREQLEAATAKKNRKRQRNSNGGNEMATSTNSSSTKYPVGTVMDARTGRHVGLGYRQIHHGGNDKHHDGVDNNQQQYLMDESPLVWCIPGANTGAVWIRFATNARPADVAACRCLGPLLAMVHVFDNPTVETNGDDEEEDPQEHQGKQQHVSMDQLLQRLSEVSTSFAWDEPLSLWQRHFRRNSLQGLKYRCSCVRDESKSYPYARHELLHQAAKYLQPSMMLSQDWKVDLQNFDLEIVWFYRLDVSAIAVSLRDYVGVGATSFEHGMALPPDISPPYLQEELSASSNASQPAIIRLRPSTAQLLLHMAQLQDGDVVLDPCVGIGTIVLECLHLQQPKYLTAMGGDLELADSLRTTASTYVARTRAFLAQQQHHHHQHQEQHSSFCNHIGLCAWDATTLPLATASVDAVVSDLPFGRSCMSTQRLQMLVPLLLNELARVVKPSTGRMVLLCGNPQILLDSMHQANLSSMASTANSDATSSVWQLPVSTCRPINIGGHLVWILVVRRGAFSPSRLNTATKDTSEGGGGRASLKRYHAKRDQRRSLPQR